jgi:hypothetical protein
MDRSMITVNAKIEQSSKGYMMGPPLKNISNMPLSFSFFILLSGQLLK